MNQSYDQTLDLTKQLISIHSPSGEEGSILRFCADWFKEHGFDQTELQDGFAAGKITGTSSEKALILCGHIDTVVAGDLNNWHFPPQQPTEQDGKLYGLGSCDMKAGMALFMILADELRRSPPPFDVWVVAVAGEEIDGSGGQAFVPWFQQQTSYKHVDCCISEPTDMLVEIGHRGSFFAEFTFTGQAGHGSDEALYARSGLKLADDLLQALPRLRQDLQTSYKHKLLGTPTIVPTVVQAGSTASPNKISDTASLVLDIRTVPAFDETITAWLDDTAKQYSANWQELGAAAKACICPDNTMLVRAALQATDTRRTSTSHGATDQVTFQSAGIDTIVYGPGQVAQAHTQNEFLALHELQASVQAYRKLIDLLSR